MLGNLFTSMSFANGVIKLSVITVYAVSAYAFVMNSTTTDDELDLGLDNTTMGNFTGYKSRRNVICF